MQTKIRGIRSGSTGDETDVKVTRLGDLHVAPAMSMEAFRTGQGRSFTAISTTAVVAIVDEPDVLSAMTLYNADPAGKTYVINRIFAYQDISSAEAARWSLWACVHPVSRAADTAAITLMDNQSGADISSSAILDTDAVVTNDGWSPWGNTADVEATGILGGAVICVDTWGLMVVPPTAAVSLHCVASSTSVYVTVGFHWTEMVIDYV